MTDDMMSLRSILEKTPDPDLLREMIGFAAERLMELEVGIVTGAGYGEKSGELRAQRNGYPDRDWQTRAGALEMRILKLRTGSVRAVPMGAKPGGGWTTETIRDLLDNGGSLTHYCANSDCRRSLGCHVSDLAIWLKRRLRFVGTRLPLQCSACGGVEISGTVSSESRPRNTAMREDPRNFRSSRTEEERQVLILVFPRYW